ncbi:LLM class flavin-dependent oxidoreductase [Gordonia humi]|uniref:LLM class flavin-dependent oxidoreductase n=1 Tax=Gordonia humi TaxID=686429 RepID=UPI00361C428F
MHSAAVGSNWGVGSGPFAGAWEAFGHDLGDRHRLFDASVGRLREVLDGTVLNSRGEALHPPGAGVRSRLWQATTSDRAIALDAARGVARGGDGLQLSRANAQRGGTVTQAQEHQARIVDAYLGAWTDPEKSPRVQISRAVYPHPDRAAAVREVTPGIRRWQSWSTHDDAKRTVGVEEYLAADRALIGPSEQIAGELLADPALAQMTDLLVSFVPGVPAFDEHRRLLADTAAELSPLLGWRPSRRSTQIGAHR